MEVQMLESTDEPEKVICNAARSDYSEKFIGNEPFEETMQGVDGETIEEKKETLIGHLLDRGHFGCFEHPQATFAVKGISRSCMAQITRHRHVSFDVQSQRYVNFSGLSPGELVVRPPSVDDAQHAGRNPNVPDDLGDEALEAKRAAIFESSIENSVESYNRLIDLGMPPEDARFVLPIGSKVNMVMSMNVRMLMHVADMRAAGDAQWEIREMTEKLLDLAEEWCPITFDYYDENMKNRKNRLAP